jgi:hypothetical protein
MDSRYYCGYGSGYALAYPDPDSEARMGCIFRKFFEIVLDFCKLLAVVSSHAKKQVFKNV